MPRPKLSDERISVPVSTEIADRLRAHAAGYGVPVSTIAARWFAAMPLDWLPFGTPEKPKRKK